MKKIQCDLCPRFCNLAYGELGFCQARINEKERIKSLSYGKILSLALDPIEKKPFAFYKPGSKILSISSFGCNMACPFCQNHWLARASADQYPSYELSSEELIDRAIWAKRYGNIGICFTYNEPLINFEYILKTAKKAKEKNLDMILVSNGQINPNYLEDLLGWIDAWNIDLKCFSKEGYAFLGGNFKSVLDTITKVSQSAHLEVTTLVVPGLSDNLDLFRKEVDFLRHLRPQPVLHITRYFPNYHYHQDATDPKLLFKMQDIAKEYLSRVVVGNL